jgi:iron complex outermembrane receptor protein
MMIKTCLAGSLAAAALLATPALAQDAPKADPQADTGDNDIVVTARKRTETLQDVPMAVTAVSNAELEVRNVQDVNGLYAQVPGLFSAPGSVNNSADFAYLTMRGVGFNAGLEPAVGVFLDGMYLPQLGFDTAFLDVDRVEVLRGPQGTLFGRNTQGGAINFVTRKPGPDTHGKVRAEIGTQSSYRASAALNGPITEGLYAGISADYNRTDGYIDNVVLGGDQDWSRQKAVRGVLRWVPSDALEFLLIGDWTDRDYNEAIRGVRLATHRYESVVDQDAPDHKSNHGVQLNMTAKLSDQVTLTSISGYRVSKSQIFTDVDSRITAQNSATIPAFAPVALTPQTVIGATLDLGIQQRFASQELRLTGDMSQVTWLAGAYYFDQRQDQQRNRKVGAGVAPFPAAFYIYETYRDDRDGYAGFGQLTWRPMARLEITGGARWSHENVIGTGNRGQRFGPPLNQTIPVVRNARDSFSNFSWMGSVAYKPSTDTMVYASFAKGWKAGGINRFPGNNAGNLPYDDESSDNYEIGLKTQTADRVLTFNAALYHIEIRNQQLLNVVPDPNGGPTPVTVVDNAARSHVDGFEAELHLRPAEGLQISNAFSYSRSRFDNFVRVFSATDQTDFSGTRFENVPQVTFFGAVDYSLPVASDKKLELHAEYQHVGSIIIQDNTRASRSRDQLTAPSYDRVNLSVSLATDSGFKLTAYVNNLFDSFDETFPSSDPFLGGDVFVVPLPPRQFGVRVAKSF